MPQTCPETPCSECDHCEFLRVVPQDGTTANPASQRPSTLLPTLPARPVASKQPRSSHVTMFTRRAVRTQPSRWHTNKSCVISIKLGERIKEVGLVGGHSQQQLLQHDALEGLGAFAIQRQCNILHTAVQRGTLGKGERAPSQQEWRAGRTHESISNWKNFCLRV